MALENTIKESEREASFKALSAATNARSSVEVNGADSRLSPETIKDFADIRKSLELVPRNDMTVDMSLNRLDELMRYV